MEFGNFVITLMYCYLFLFVSLAVIQAIYIEMFFCKESMSVPFSSFPWILASPESGLKYLSVLCLKLSIYQFCRKQLTKLANLLMHSQCALSEPISSSRKTRKLTVCRFIETSIYFWRIGIYPRLYLDSHDEKILKI